jgi:hypothetical protein
VCWVSVAGRRSTGSTNATAKDPGLIAGSRGLATSRRLKQHPSSPRLGLGDNNGFSREQLIGVVLVYLYSSLEDAIHNLTFTIYKRIANGNDFLRNNMRFIDQSNHFIFQPG